MSGIDAMIHTERLFLRPIQATDKEALFGYRSDALTNAYQSWIPKTMEEVEAFIQKNPTAFNQSESWFQLVMIEKASNTLIGDLGVHFMDAQNKQCELGCTLDKHWQSKGYAREAMTAVISYLFNELDKHRIIGSVDPANVPSIRMMEGLGFRREAHFRKSLWWKGDWVDDIVYAVLAEEWRPD